jgi:hypothetical protein
MSVEAETRSVCIEMHLDTPHDAVLAHGHFGPLFTDYRAHVARWETLPGPPLLSTMQRLLACASLHLSCRPRDQFSAWTLNLATPAANLFVTGDNAAGMITGRVITDGVKTTPRTRLFVETRRSMGQHTESYLEVEEVVDVLAMFQTYYLKSEQTQARLFELGTDEFLLVFGLPNVADHWLENLTAATAREGLIAGAEAGLQQVEERVFRWKCGCDPQRMLRVLRSLFRDRAHDLFRGDAQVETFCPRCGRRWWITREDFFRQEQKLGMS